MLHVVICRKAVATFEGSNLMDITRHDIGTVARVMQYLQVGTAVTILKYSWQYGAQ